MCYLQSSAGAQGGDCNQVQNPLKQKPFDFNALQLRALLLEREKKHIPFDTVLLR